MIPFLKFSENLEKRPFSAFSRKWKFKSLSKLCKFLQHQYRILNYTKFLDNQSSCFCIILLTIKQTDKQTDSGEKHHLHGGGNYVEDNIHFI